MGKKQTINLNPITISPVFKTILADLDTPLSCFMKLKKDYPKEPAFLLESVEAKDRHGRFSFIGIAPFLTFRSKEHKVWLSGMINETIEVENPFELLKTLMKSFNLQEMPQELRFPGGAVGFIGYDVIRFFERMPNLKPKSLKIDDMYFVFPQQLVIFDNFTHKMTLVVFSINGEDVTIAMEKLYNTVRKPFNYRKKGTFSFGSMISNTNEEEFKGIVAKAKEYICAGDIFQVVLSQRFCVDVGCDDINLYRALRVVNPSPYMFFLDFVDYSLIGSSPEILVRLENGVVEVRPIAGTRRRGETVEEDMLLEEELLADEKELAEHVMLVDLGRNDVGRVAKVGTVKVPELKIIERYSHVMHIVSSVTGDLQEGLDAFDVFKATFPAGTVSGAPKIRAMEIIEELEKEKREFYAGGVGYFGYNGNMDFCITIRTMLKRGKKVYIQAGAGIVADSVPENEYLETINKAKALMKSITNLKEIIE
ncbi:MAG: anthranilate synthase component I [bacterium]